MSGYSASSDSLGQASKTISTDASNTQNQLSKNTATTIAAADWGQAHGSHQGDYAAAMTELGKGISGMCTTLTSFAGLLGQASTNYASVEGSNASSVSNSGS
ncbi:MAG TPA: hypothetical protein VG756_28485 [Pseudonocardiaceae bacterium]|jgi:hypothetical protein|nr:hypothetical protein [Pseudonocardiaceae bacterium]